MSLADQNPIPFGANDRPPCPRCHIPMRITGRTPHPQYGEEYELQTTACVACGYEGSRSTNANGQLRC